MKHQIKIIVSACAVSTVAFAATAQETSNPKIDGQDQTSYRVNQTPSAARFNDSAKASDLIGATLKNNRGEKLGKVSDLALDVESGRIVQVIISTGGFLGMGTALVAVPPAAFQYDATQKALHLDASKEKLAGAPKFDASNWDESTRSNRVTEVYGYYGQRPYFIAASEGAWTTNADGTFANTLPRNMDGTINTAGGSAMDTVHNTQVARDVVATNNTVLTRNSDGTFTRNYYPNGNLAHSSWSELGYVQKASKLMGTPVKNLQDQKLGKVDNLIVDLPAGRIVAVVISSGGSLGMDNELSAVPPTALKYNTEHDALQMAVSKETLANSPHFQANHWPNFRQPAYASEIYHAYGVEPYFNDGATSEPDNTARNVRDHNDGAVTPLDQGNSQADINTTSRIRKEIIANNDMSTNAKNVKIITMDGHVTLRGPVNTVEEKRLIGEIADRIAQAANVDNQLEVSQSTTTTSN